MCLVILELDAKWLKSGYSDFLQDCQQSVVEPFFNPFHATAEAGTGGVL